MLAARAAALALAASVAAAPLPAAAGPHHALRYDRAVDLPLTIGAGALWIGSELAKPYLAPEGCRWCDPPGLDRDARTRLVWSNTVPARVTSDLLAFAVAPAAALVPLAAAADTRDDALLDALFVIEAVAIAADVNQLVKFAVARERPFVHFGNYAEPDRPADPDDQLSFYSGHTSTAFSFAAAAGTVASLRGYRSAPWIWGVGMALASGVAYFRVAADRHYLTDVLTGAVIGTAVGVAAPRLLHPRERSGAGDADAERVTFVPLPIGLRVAF
ncbi:phosphatase PAP2 family protein [Anaeromyxobacter sp. Fw109-5]|uniref:phosphatase PAP2 family protein n=1 Tax=Anaeromyxobacter sp. (strain Fw109-5) TaxID=404589 RepID=UPI0000ED6D15|nr:phosphatase PAP2 family protein [Anaeromyxobacter sp. Fw109-5]ABS28546.1 phosphoesterase PA-phosphatase related [Anaeromyxobacter sp. Fw109-5]